ncbi:MAG: antA/AntB antirepressor family protein [Mogibacterium sp.]|nr:antA/AntB antirepressor family protein [Mogibacterium sp.]
MGELIRTDIDNQTVSARELHEKLNISTRFNDWFPRMCEYGFTAGVDFYSKMSKTNEKGGRPATDYDVTIDMAKQICMIQRTPEGKKVREYLINLEKAWNTPELIMARALKMADRQITDLKEENKQLIESNVTLALENNQLTEENYRNKPMVEFCKTVSGSRDSIHIGQFAKLIGVGQNTMFDWLRQKGYLGRARSNYNMPLQKYLNMGIFSLKENIAKDRDGNTIIYPPTPLVTGKGQVYLHDKYNQSQWQQATLF